MAMGNEFANGTFLENRDFSMAHHYFSLEKRDGNEAVDRFLDILEEDGKCEKDHKIFEEEFPIS